VLTVAGIQLAYLLSGVVVVEIVFSWNGLGQLALQSSSPAITPCCRARAAVRAGVPRRQPRVDLLYAALDPRSADMTTHQDLALPRRHAAGRPPWSAARRADQPVGRLRAVVLVGSRGGILGDQLAPYAPNQVDVIRGRLAAPSAHHPFGIRPTRRDILSRVLAAPRLPAGVCVGGGLARSSA